MKPSDGSKPRVTIATCVEESQGGNDDGSSDEEKMVICENVKSSEIGE